MPKQSMFSDCQTCLIRNEASRLMAQLDASDSHGPEHILTVESMALDFAAQSKQAHDPSLVSVLALLHDADDAKLTEQPNAMEHARSILDGAGASNEQIYAITGELCRFGYRNRLNGLTPKTFEGSLVSDADMCQVMGLSGILRLTAYNLLTLHVPFFDPEQWPREHGTPDEYQKQHASTVVNHLFEKVLRLPDKMLTDPGKQEACLRFSRTVGFLQQFFIEQNVPQWSAYLESFLSQC